MIEKCFVLSGGGCRGFAHFGVVKALQENGISPGKIAGTSAGAIAGAFLADGFTPDEIKEIFVTQVGLGMFSFNIFSPGLMSMKKMREFLQKNLRHTTFEKMKMPFYVTATNFIDGSQKIFSKGDVIEPVLAACSIPVLFSPFVIDGIPYVDGGLSNNLPVEPFADIKNETVCVYVNPVKPLNAKEGVMEIMDRAIHLSFRATVSRSANGCYLYIEPSELDKFDLFEIYKFREIFDIGYNSAKAVMQNFKI